MFISTHTYYSAINKEKGHDSFIYKMWIAGASLYFLNNHHSNPTFY